MTRDIDPVLNRFLPRATQPSLPAAGPFAGLLLLAIATASGPEQIFIAPHIDWQRTDGTVVFERRDRAISEADILRVLGRVHDMILSEAVELDPDARALLYDHLWDLYA